MDCRSQAVVKFKTRLGFSEHDIGMANKKTNKINVKIFKQKNVIATICF